MELAAPEFLLLEAELRGLGEYLEIGLVACCGAHLDRALERVNFNGILGPVVEELYFRGYLLPRLAWMPRWAPTVSGLLFSLYHTFTPWEQLPRLLVVIPLGYVMQRSRNIYWGMIVHCIFNTGCMVMLLLSFLAGTG